MSVAATRAPSAAGIPDTSRQFRKSRLRAALVLTLGVLAVEVVGGIVSGSLALLADAAHMFTDVAALTLAYAGMALSDRAPTRRHTFGLARAEVLAAFVNAQLLLVASIGILIEAWRRFHVSAPVQTGLMLWVAALGLAANLAAIALLRGAREENLNMKAAYLEVLTDAFGSVAVLVGGVVMARTGFWRLDALISAALALFILPRGVAILRSAAHILLEGAPEGIDIPALRSEILSVPGVQAIHDLHFWTLTSGLHSASVHIRAAASCARGEVLLSVQRILKLRAGVDHATIQVELDEEADCVSSPTHA